jgi:hypothetical protein
MKGPLAAQVGGGSDPAALSAGRGQLGTERSDRRQAGFSAFSAFFGFFGTTTGATSTHSR